MPFSNRFTSCIFFFTFSFFPPMHHPSHSGSIHGGQLITITGLGFTDSSRVSINGKNCLIHSQSSTQIICQTPPSSITSLSGHSQNLIQATLEVQPGFLNTLTYNYDQSMTPIVEAFSQKHGTDGDLLKIFGRNFGQISKDSFVMIGQDPDIPCRITALVDTQIQ